MRKTNENIKKKKNEIVWKNVVIYLILHILALYGAYQFFFAKLNTILFATLYTTLGGMGITAGAHRLWAHRSYKAKWPLRLILMLCNCIAMQDNIIVWARDHRCHHKWTDSNADPYTIKRGFFFAHVGWLLYYWLLSLFLCIIFPTLFCVIVFNEDWVIAMTFAGFFRYVLSLNGTWAINSVTHSFGYKPYDRNITATNHVIANFFTYGEGGHNYHHAFPQDYKTSEFPLMFNVTTIVINIFAKIGWAYDLKTTTSEMIVKKKSRENVNGDKCRNTKFA